MSCWKSFHIARQWLEESLLSFSLSVSLYDYHDNAVAELQKRKTNCEESWGDKETKREEGTHTQSGERGGVRKKVPAPNHLSPKTQQKKFY